MEHKKLLDGYYYVENGLTVLTEEFHLSRGYCCGNGCRHCPYDHEQVPPAIRQNLDSPQPYHPKSSVSNPEHDDSTTNS